MKAEHRKELQTNVLAERLGQIKQSLKEGPSRGTVLLIGAIALVVILGFVWNFLSRSSRETESKRWLKWDEVTTPAQLNAFLEDPDLKGTPQERMARFQVARKALFEGTRDLGQEGTEHEEAVKKIENAAKIYDQLSKEVTDRPILLQEALLGSARAHEALGQIDEATSYYRRLTQEYPSSLLARDAQEQIDRLSKETKNKDLEQLRSRYNTKGG